MPTVNSSFMTTPVGTDSPAQGDNVIVALKGAWKERLEKEHEFDLTESGSQPRQGLHKQGSAVAFYQDTEPTQRNGQNLLGDTGDSDTDKGLLLVNSTDQTMKVWTGTAWVGVVPGEYDTTTVSGNTTESALSISKFYNVTATANLNLTAGATRTGVRAKIKAALGVTCTLYLVAGGPLSLSGNTAEFEWNGTSWEIVSIKYPVLLLGREGAASDYTGSFTAPYTGAVYVELLGGGGGGGSAAGSATAAGSGGGGGGGGYVASMLYLTAGTVYSYTAGKYGAGSTSPTAGGYSVFGSVSVPGGAAGGNHSSGASVTNGGLGGIPTGVVGSGGVLIARRGGNGGDGSGETWGSLDAHDGRYPTGLGGSSGYGPGGEGRCSNTTGGNATFYGAGGAGGVNVGASSTYYGGNGYQGFVRVWAGRTL